MVRLAEARSLYCATEFDVGPEDGDAVSVALRGRLIQVCDLGASIDEGLGRPEIVVTGVLVDDFEVCEIEGMMVARLKDELEVGPRPLVSAVVVPAISIEDGEFELALTSVGPKGRQRLTKVSCSSFKSQLAPKSDQKNRSQTHP